MKTMTKGIASIFLAGVFCFLSCSTNDTASQRAKTMNSATATSSTPSDAPKDNNGRGEQPPDMYQPEQVSDAESAKSKTEESGGSLIIQYAVDGGILQFVNHTVSEVKAKPMSHAEVERSMNEQHERTMADPMTRTMIEFRSKIPKTVDIRQATDREQLVREFVNTLGNEAALKKGIKFYDANMNLRFRWPRLSTSSAKTSP